MTNEPSPDPDERPGAVDRLVGRLDRARSVPGPDPSHLLPALACPAPRLLEGGPTTVPSPEIQATPLRVHAPCPGGPAYHPDLALPERVDPRSATSTCFNEVVDITFLRIPRANVSPGETDE